MQTLQDAQTPSDNLIFKFFVICFSMLFLFVYWMIFGAHVNSYIKLYFC
jgi:hypothetical protein